MLREGLSGKALVGWLVGAGLGDRVRRRGCRAAPRRGGGRRGGAGWPRRMVAAPAGRPGAVGAGSVAAGKSPRGRDDGERGLGLGQPAPPGLSLRWSENGLEFRRHTSSLRTRV